MTKWWLTVVLAAATASAQAPASGGFETEWDLRKLLESMTGQAGRLKPILEQANPSGWQDASAAGSYAPQWKAAQDQLRYLSGSAAAFAKQPERLTLALEALFRLEAMERSLASYAEGMKKHGNAAVAELLEGTVRENSNNRERLRQYVTELAQTKEQEFQIADQEAQRCRANLSRQAPVQPKPAAKPPVRKK